MSSITFYGLAEKNYFQQLCAFNPNWKKYETRVPELEYQQFKSDKEYIQSHLKSVIGILKSNPTSHLSQNQYQSRIHLIDVLDHYRLSGKFPINYHIKKRIPVFIDENGTHCAVGYLLRETGFGSVAKRISKTNNYVWVKEIIDPELRAWQQHYGFSLEELKLIQGAYDFYLDDALTLPNRLEIPQKPDVMLLYFDNSDFSNFNIWCKGEGSNGVLNGKWIQNYAFGQPWIVGYYKNGERTGKWEEYYQGTTQLCRTEHWKDDKLNGLRTRFDRNGNIIEKIYFEDGNAVTKINYDLGYNPKTYVRTPIDSVTVETQIFDLQGNCIAKGRELIYNPGNLQWFQNIELTALNTFSLSAESMQMNSNYNDLAMNGSVKEFHSPRSFQTPSLVEYKKIGSWTYYRENVTDLSKFIEALVVENKLDIKSQFSFFMEVNWNLSSYFPFRNYTDIYDSLQVIYTDNKIQELELIGATNYERYELVHRAGYEFELDNIDFYSYRRSAYDIVSRRRANDIIRRRSSYDIVSTLEAIGRIDEHGNKTGIWYYFGNDGTVSTKYEFVLPKELILVSDAK